VSFRNVKEILSIQSLKEIDYNVVLGRLMRRQNISVMVRGVQNAAYLVCILALLVVVAVVVPDFLTKMSMTSDLSTRVASITKQISSTEPKPVSGDKQWDLLTQRQPFGPLGRAAGMAPSAPTPPPSPLMLSLIGTFITGGQEPYAIIEDKKKQNQDMFLLEQNVFDQAVLKKIYQDRVEVDHNGKIEVLRIDEISGAPSGGVANEADSFVVEEAELDKGLENLPLLLTQARAVPYFKDGRSIGLRLFAIKSGSLYEKVGLRNGDILKTINGNNLGDISQALKLFEQLKEERSINLMLERDKQDREFKYTIR
jgi:general secretion pathway protein C